MPDCIFCSIVKGEPKADIVFSSEDCIAFHDIHPKAPVHILVIPRKHINSVAEMTEEDTMLMGQLIKCAKDIASKNGLSSLGYKLVFNVGRGGGQVIDHVHLHLLGGWKDTNETKKEN